MGLVTSGMGHNLVTMGLGLIQVLPPVPEPERENFGSVPIIIQEGKTEVLKFHITHVNLLTELTIVTNHIVPELKKLLLTIDAPLSTVVPIIIKHINVLIEGTRKSINTGVSEIDVSIGSSSIDITTTEETRKIE